MKLLSERLHERLLGYVPDDYGHIRRRYRMDLGKLYVAEDESLECDIPLPDYCGTIEDLVTKASSPVEDKLKRLSTFLAKCPSDEYLMAALTARKPQVPGWFVFNGERWIRSQRPQTPYAVLDFETLPSTESNGVWWPYLATCLTQEHLYIWVYDPEAKVSVIDWDPQGTLFVNHNMSYDRQYLADEYLRQTTAHEYWCTMSAWIATRGMSNQQRPAYAKLKDSGAQVKWVSETAPNGLADVYEWYHGTLEVLPGYYIDKGTRDGFVKAGKAWLKDSKSPCPHEYVSEHWQEIVTYGLLDSIAAYKVAKAVYPEWLEAQPHPVSRLAMFLLGKVWVPHGDRLDGLADRVDDQLAQADQLLSDKSLEVAHQVLEDSGYRHLLTYSKTGKSCKKLTDDQLAVFLAAKDPQLQELDWQVVTTGANIGLPRWYVDYKKKPVPETRLGVYILGVQWLGQPVIWVPEGRSGYWSAGGQPIPDPEDPEKPLKTIYTRGTAKLEPHVLTASRGMDAQDILTKKKEWATWVSIRSRVRAVHSESPEGYRVVLPTIAPTGTLTRRCADSLYQVLPNPKPNKPGTEFKSTIQAGPNDLIVGADVDSQELWLAALLGDRDRVPGSNPLSVMVSIGLKSLGTDPHSVLATEVGISRDSAKTVWYGLIYGLGYSGLYSALVKAMPGASPDNVDNLVTATISKTKGVYSTDFGQYLDGLASRTFNSLRTIANSKRPRTPTLGAAMTWALCGIKDYGTSRTNWVVQSSGVDMRDLMLTLAYYLFTQEGIDARLMMSIHDEYRYVVAKEHALKAAWLLQVAHLYTRAKVITSLGLEHLPLGTSYFSGVDIDTVLRKDPVDFCQTPTQAALCKNKYPGETITPQALAERMRSL